MWETCKVWLARYNVWDDRTALRLLKALLFPRKPVLDKVQHIVVFRVGNIGDTVVAIPALVALREAFPDTQITLLTSAGHADLKGAEEVLSAFPKLLNRVISYRPTDIKSWTKLKQLKSEILHGGPVDLWVSLPLTLQTVFRPMQEIVFARWLGSRNACGFTLLLPEVFRRSYARHQALPKTSDWLLSLVQHELNLPPQKQDLLHYFESPQPNIMQRIGLDAKRPLLLVNAGAKLAIKRWPTTYFHQALQQVLEQYPATQIALLGSASERDLNEQILHHLPGNVLNLAGQLTLGETWSLMPHASAILSNDTGPMHMAGLLNQFGIVPMSGQFPAPLWHPIGEQIQIIRQPVACAPCFHETCPLPEQHCLTTLSPLSVAQALCEYFASLPR